MPLAEVDVAVAGEDAVLAADDARHEVALLVGVGDALAVDDALCCGREVGPDVVETVLDLHDLVEGDGCAGLALDTAGTVAGVEVAAELLGQQVRRDEDVANLEDGR